MQIEDRLARFVCELQVADVPASAQRAMRQMVMSGLLVKSTLIMLVSEIEKKAERSRRTTKAMSRW